MKTFDEVIDMFVVNATSLEEAHEKSKELKGAVLINRNLETLNQDVLSNVKFHICIKGEVVRLKEALSTQGQDEAYFNALAAVAVSFLVIGMEMEKVSFE